MQAFFASSRIEERPAEFLDAEDRLKMRSTLRKYEDDIDAANEQFRVMEEALRKKFQAAPKPREERTRGG